jgi:hypothetical protein
MKYQLRSVIWAMATLLSLSLGASAVAQPMRRKAPRSPSVVRTDEPELRALVRRAQEAAEQAQLEARRAREQSEALGAQLSAATRELAELRRALESRVEPGLERRVGDLSSEIRELKSSRVAQSGDEEKLERLEEQVEINSAQIREQAQTKVESDSRFRIRLSGMILANLHYNSNDLQRTEPLFAPPPARSDQRGTFGSTFRQTRLGLAVTGLRVGGAQVSAEAELDFYGGTIGQVDGDLLGVLRMRTASVRFDWERAAISAGLEAPLISPRNPTSIAAVWYPPLAGAGNLWQWRPQVTAERLFRLDEASDLVAQGGFLPPFGESVGGEPTKGVPGYEARIGWQRRLDEERRFEIGVGGYYGRRDFDFNRGIDGWVASADWLAPVGRRITLSGELYSGRAVTFGEQSGGRVDRAFALSGPVDDPSTLIRGVRSSGGWAQLSLEARRDLEFNLAYGQEDPDNEDIRAGLISAGTRLKNQAGSLNFIYQLRPTVLLSLEYRRLWTEYAAGRTKNNHYNLAVAYVF